MTVSRNKVRVYNTTKSSCLGEQIDIADSTMHRLVGLLGKQSLASGCGLFIVPTQAIHTVGMSFPIDVVFIDKKHRVLGVRHSLRPLRLTRIYWRAVGVLELPAGTILNTHTETGDQLSLVRNEFD